MQNRENLSAALETLDFRVYPSSSNFVFVEHKKKAGADIYLALKQAAILVRYFNSARIDNCLRISIGSEQECNTLVKALKVILAE